MSPRACRWLSRGWLCPIGTWISWRQLVVTERCQEFGMSQAVQAQTGRPWHRPTVLVRSGSHSGIICRHSEAAARPALGRRCSLITPWPKCARDSWRGSRYRSSLPWTTCAPSPRRRARTSGPPRAASRLCLRSPRAPSAACTSTKPARTSTRCLYQGGNAGGSFGRRSHRGSTHEGTGCSSKRTPSSQTWAASPFSAQRGLQRQFSSPAIPSSFRRALLTRSATRRPPWRSPQTTWQEPAWRRRSRS
mmetsp:Transcript_98634/g.307246  ORF Transcript_98634/g.307246 Transcript_98634/m.307246 type:complete len:248 (-) Transcript_98634:220-963(-)